MLESNRAKVIKRIKKILREKELLLEKKKELQELLFHPIIQRYNKLNKEIENIEKKHLHYDTLDNIILINFYNNIKSNNCKHDIWIHDGLVDKKSKYVCLECRNTTITDNPELFESTHFVLKGSNKLSPAIFYSNLYYKYLYTNDSEKAKYLIIQKYENDKNKQKLRKI